jgi:hypothetical protein
MPKRPPPDAGEVLGRRALNRALLARQGQGLTPPQGGRGAPPPGLLCFRDEQGRELLDLPDAPRPDPDTPAPARFMADWDNVLLSHADRSRIVAEEHRGRIPTVNGVMPGTILVDGFVAGTWKIERHRGAATLRVEPFAPLSAGDAAALAEEGGRLLDFAAAEIPTREVRFAAPE